VVRYHSLLFISVPFFQFAGGGASTDSHFMTRARMPLGNVKRACFVTIVVALASGACAEHDTQPILGLFDMAKLFLASRTDADAAAPPLNSFNSFGGNFAGFMESAKLLAAGQPESLTTANIDAILREMQSNDTFRDVGLVFQGFNATDFDDAYELFFNDTNTESAEFRRRSFSTLFDGILNVTASAMSGVDDTRVSYAMTNALRDASMAAHLALAADTDEGRRAAALALYDRVNGMISESQSVLRGAMRDGPNADYANRLLAAATGASGFHFYDDIASKFYVHSTTTRHPDDRSHPSHEAVRVVEHESNELESVVAPVIGSVVGFAVLASALGVVFVRIRASRRGASSKASPYTAADAALASDATTAVDAAHMV